MGREMGADNLEIARRAGFVVVIGVVYMREHREIQQGGAHIFAIFIH